MSKGTRATNVRLTDDQKAKIERIKVACGCATTADAIRRAIDTQCALIDEQSKAVAKLARKQIRENSGEGG